jgi:translation initiation factor 1
MKGDYREVYSTDKGAICPECSRSLSKCSCRSDRNQQIVGDGCVKVRRETQGRGGKTVTTISGLELNREQLKALLSDLKRLVGAGGSEKDGVLELQGDHCELVLADLAKRGIRGKRAGG